MTIAVRSDAVGMPGATQRTHAPGSGVHRGQPPSAPGPVGPSPFARLLRGVAAEVDRGEALARDALGAARRPGEVATADLIALQAGIYRYSEALELTARLVDRSTGAIKAVLQSP